MRRYGLLGRNVVQVIITDTPEITTNASGVVRLRRVGRTVRRVERDTLR